MEFFQAEAMLMVKTGIFKWHSMVQALTDILFGCTVSVIAFGLHHFVEGKDGGVVDAGCLSLACTHFLYCTFHRYQHHFVCILVLLWFYYQCWFMSWVFSFRVCL